MWYIYKITNTITNKEYIGQRKLRKNKNPDTDNYMGSGTYIKKSILKYGIENFKKEIIKNDINCQTSANIFEIIYIKKYNTIAPCGYNLTKGGSSLNGYHHTNETRKKMSKASKGRKKSIEHTIKNSESHKGQIVSDETREKISKKLKGICKPAMSNETKEKISKKLKGTKLSTETKEKISIGLFKLNKGNKIEICNIKTSEKIIFKNQQLCSEFFELDFRTIRKYILNNKPIKNYLIAFI
jgi:group I intron endonuclease